MKKLALLLVTIFVVTLSWAFADGFRNLRARLRGFNEPPAVSTVARGSFQARINDDQTIDYVLSYSELEGSVQQAHIHLGQKSVNGGITVFLCTNLANAPLPPATTQPCPPSPATITGTITVADVSPDTMITPPATQVATQGGRSQGLEKGDFAELVRAIRAGVTYVNVHSSKFPGGEVRDQIGPGHGEHGD